MAAIAGMQNALRGEVRELKLKIVQLETAEADNLRLRKDLSSAKQGGEDEKAQLELDFLNRLADIARENNTRVTELEGKLAEHTRVNRRLNNEIVTSETPEMVNARIQAIEKEHQREIAQIVNQKNADMERLQYQLRVVQTKRDDMTRKLEETMVDLEWKDKKFDSLELELALGGNGSEDVQRMLRLANEENRQLQKQMASMEQELKSKNVAGDNHMKETVHRLEKENSSLRDAIQQAESGKKNQDISIVQLERRNHDLKMSLQRLEKQVNGGNSNISYGDDTSVDLERKYQQLEVALQETKAALKVAKKRNEELNYELQKASTAKIESNPDLNLLEKRNESLVMTCEKLENEVDEVRGETQKAVRENALLLREIKEVQSLLRSTEKENTELTNKVFNLEASIQKREAKPIAPQKRTSTTIRQMEKNLKREKEINNGITAKFRKQYSNRDMDSSKSEFGNTDMNSLREENRKLNGDVNQLQQKLEKERKMSRDLRLEISDMRATTKENSSKSKERVRVPLSSPSLGRQAEEEGTPSSRGSVRGIAALFENANFQSPALEASPKPRASFTRKAPVASDEVKGLKRDLGLERTQVTELEEELTRQCEINCSLLKEISALSLEMEAKRIDQSRNFKTGSQDNVNEKEVKNLKSQMDDLVSELSSVTEKKDELEAQDLANQENFASLQRQVNNKVKEFENIHANDKKAIQRLQRQVTHLEEEISETLALVEDLKQKLNAQEGSSSQGAKQGDLLEMKKIIQEKESMIGRITSEKEQLVLSMNGMAGYRKGEIEELQSELMQMESRISEKSRLVESLNGKLEQRNYGMQRIKRGDDNESQRLEKENSNLRQKLLEGSAERRAAEAKLMQFINDKGTSSKSVQILRERNAALKFEVEKLTKKLARMSGNKPNKMDPEAMEVIRVAI
jgi:chromosome segregation ATPase